MTLTYDLLLHYLNRQAKTTAKDIINELNIKDGQCIADIGAGGGFFSYAFAQQNPKSKIFAIDIEQRHLDFIKRQFIRKKLININTLLVDATSNVLPLDNNSIDLIFMRNMFHDLRNPHNYFMELKEKLTPSGRITIIEFLPTLRFVEGRTGHCTEESRIEEIMTSVGYSLQSTSQLLKPRQSFSIYKRQGDI